MAGSWCKFLFFHPPLPPLGEEELVPTVSTKYGNSYTVPGTSYFALILLVLAAHTRIVNTLFFSRWRSLPLCIILLILS